MIDLGRNVFQVGDSALEVCKTIVRNNPEISEVMVPVFRTLKDPSRSELHYYYQVLLNMASSESLRRMGSDPMHPIKAVYRHRPTLAERSYSREEFLSLNLSDERRVHRDQLQGIYSRVLCNDGRNRHIAMIDFESEDIGVIKDSLVVMLEGRGGAILHSGMSFHFYGDFLLNDEDWRRFTRLAADMPKGITDRRWARISLCEGTGTLRLDSNMGIKPQAPRVVEVL